MTVHEIKDIDFRIAFLPQQTTGIVIPIFNILPSEEVTPSEDTIKKLVAVRSV